MQRVHGYSDSAGRWGEESKEQLLFERDEEVTSSGVD